MLSASPAIQRHVKNVSKGQNIKVFVRVRPMNGNENRCCIECPPTNREVVVHERPYDKHTKKFTFDRVFPTQSKQTDVYKYVAKPLVEEVLDGFNCTIFAYGQTGTGKTHTMEGEYVQLGSSVNDNENSGIIPRCINDLFDELRIQKVEFTMRVSFVELYNEELFDLLSANDDLSKLRLYEDPARKGSCIIQGMEEVVVRNKVDVFSIVEKGSQKRKTAATLMNAHSSRSHTVFTVTVHMKENDVDGYELMKIGKLHLVDLAGSENIGRSGAMEKRAREAGNINQSLLTLGRVIASLVEKTPHVPYRESKLTRLLQDALGGRTKTSIIATISPAQINLEETLSTLDYASRAKNIKNKPEVNQKLHKKELIGEYTNEIEKLRRDLMAMREKNGVYLANENYREMVETIEKQSEEISEKIGLMRALQTEHDRQMELFDRVKSDYRATAEKLESAEEEVSKTKHVLDATQKLLVNTHTEKEEQKFLVKAHERTESSLRSQAQSLIDVADSTTDRLGKLHDKLDRKRKVEETNAEISSSFEKKFEAKIESLCTSIDAFKSHHLKMSASQLDQLGCRVSGSMVGLEGLSSNLGSIHAQVKDSVSKLQDFLYGLSCDDHDFALLSLGAMEESVSKNDSSSKTFLCELLKGLSAASGEIGQQKARADAAIRRSKQMIEDFVSCCAANHDNQKAAFASIEASVEAIKSVPSTILSRVEAKSAQIRQSVKAELHDLAKLKQMIVDLEENSQQRLSFLPILGEKEQACLNFVEEASNTIPLHVNKVKELNSNNEIDLAEKKRVGIEYLNETRSELELSTASIDERLSRIKISTEEEESRLAVARENFRRQANDFQTKCKDNAESNTAQRDDQLRTFALRHSSEIDSAVERVRSLNDDMKSYLEAHRTKFDRSASEFRDFLTGHRDEIQESGDALRDFFGKEIVTDQPTGLTPARAEFTYPKLIPATSPHDTILNRLRTSQEVSRIPIPTLDLESPGESLNMSEESNVSAESEQQSPETEGPFSLPIPPVAATSRQLSVEDLKPRQAHLTRTASTKSLPDSVKENAIPRYRPSRKDTSKASQKFETKELPVSTRPRRVLAQYNQQQ